MGSKIEAEHYDLLTLGSGEAAKFIAWTIAATHGKRCAVIERQWYGGSCPNVACLPSKNVIHSAKVHQLSSHGEDFGIPQAHESGRSAGKTNMRAVVQRKKDMVAGLTAMQEGGFKQSGVGFIWGDGKFVDHKTIEVTNADGQKRVVKGDTIIICTGSRAIISDVPGLKEAKPLTHVELLELEELPSHLIVLGGGYVGLEFAQAMRSFGSAVTVIDKHERVLVHEDEDVAAQLQEVLLKEGVVFSTSTSVTEVSGTSGESVTVRGTASGEAFEVKGSHLLCATGRVPNTDNIGLEATGIKLTEKGHVAVDEWCRTSEDGVFAVGDCSGSPYFTHIGYDDFRIVNDSLSGMSTSEPRRSTRQVPFTLFTDPEVAHVGLREHEAQTKGIKYRLAKIPMSAFLRSRTLGETDGFAKALASAEDDTILGFTAIGPGVGELLPVVQLAMKKKLPYSEIVDMIFTHPTLSEGLMFVFGAVPPRS
ncbi:hypothetical protein LTR37_007535 [Vermiconidia calcicola]|uniref:Uncharacterized protein n=1 Tax=Vermiconidia calcicola TaxID=1690605 RepID=A0ACC3ND21_9PEZI|nr:hypothetical protein LTR37_007535 [Vermiconidia calcicola]